MSAAALIRPPVMAAPSDIQTSEGLSYKLPLGQPTKETCVKADTAGDQYHAALYDLQAAAVHKLSSDMHMYDSQLYGQTALLQGRGQRSSTEQAYINAYHSMDFPYHTDASQGCTEKPHALGNPGYASSPDNKEEQNPSNHMHHVFNLLSRKPEQSSSLPSPPQGPSLRAASNPGPESSVKTTSSAGSRPLERPQSNISSSYAHYYSPFGQFDYMRPDYYSTRNHTAVPTYDSYGSMNTQPPVTSPGHHIQHTADVSHVQHQSLYSGLQPGPLSLISPSYNTLLHNVAPQTTTPIKPGYSSPLPDVSQHQTHPDPPDGSPALPRDVPTRDVPKMDVPTRNVPTSVAHNKPAYSSHIPSDIRNSVALSQSASRTELPDDRMYTTVQNPAGRNSLAQSDVRPSTVHDQPLLSSPLPEDLSRGTARSPPGYTSHLPNDTRYNVAENKSDSSSPTTSDIRHNATYTQADRRSTLPPSVKGSTVGIQPSYTPCDSSQVKSEGSGEQSAQGTAEMKSHAGPSTALAELSAQGLGKPHQPDINSNQLSRMDTDNEGDNSLSSLQHVQRSERTQKGGNSDSTGSNLKPKSVHFNSHGSESKDLEVGNSHVNVSNPESKDPENSNSLSIHSCESECSGIANSLVSDAVSEAGASPPAGQKASHTDDWSQGGESSRRMSGLSSMQSENVSRAERETQGDGQSRAEREKEGGGQSSVEQLSSPQSPLSSQKCLIAANHQVPDDLDHGQSCDNNTDSDTECEDDPDSFHGASMSMLSQYQEEESSEDSLVNHKHEVSEPEAHRGKKRRHEPGSDDEQGINSFERDLIRRITQSHAGEILSIRHALLERQQEKSSSESESSYLAVAQPPQIDSTVNVAEDEEATAYLCPVCSKSFKCLSGLSTHLNSHSANKGFPCLLCRKTFSQRLDLERHNRIHSGERPYPCTACDKKFSRRDSLRDHLKTHTGDKPFKCTICDKAFAQRSNYNRHIKIHPGADGDMIWEPDEDPTNQHIRGTPYDCNECDKSFSQKVNLDRHILTHTREKPFRCQTCGKSFAQKSVLQRHEMTHTGVKLYTCVECNKSFIQSSDLTRHSRTHTGEKPYTCHICDKSFTQAGVLKRHQQTHERKKPFQCIVCQALFVSSKHLLKHVETHAADMAMWKQMNGAAAADLAAPGVPMATDTQALLDHITSTVSLSNLNKPAPGTSATKGSSKERDPEDELEDLSVLSRVGRVHLAAGEGVILPGDHKDEVK